MLGVIVSAKKKDREFWDSFDTLLEKNFAAIHAYGHCLKIEHREPQLIVTDAESFSSIQSDCTIIIFRDMADISIEHIGGHCAVAVTDSCNNRLLPLVASTKLPAITCGLSAKDTLTLSSISADGAVIGLQRSISCFDGSVAEPQEIPVKIGRGADSFALMAAASIYILSGKIDCLHEIHL